jgi:hypothetical protein
MSERHNDNNILDSAWDQVVGGMDWLKSVLIGEFADHRSLSAIVADMLVSFIPGVVIVTSARDAIAVILRLANYPEKRKDTMEWVLLCACLIVIALPVAMAVGGAAAAGVGAIVGGIAGSELGAALRAVMLLLIKEASKLVELVQFLQKFIKGDILKFLRAVKFVQYEKALLGSLKQFAGKLVDIVRSLRTHLESLNYFDVLKTTIAKLAEWERKFYAVQQDAINQIPKALAELDARLAKVLAQTAPKEAHTVASGVQAHKPAAPKPVPQRIRDAPGRPLAKVGDDVRPAAKPAPGPKQPANPGTPPKATPGTPPKGNPGKPPEPPPKDKPDPVQPANEGPNSKKQEVLDATVDADRARITQLSKEGKIAEAQAILQPYVDAAKTAKTPAEKEAAMNAIINRLDVTSDKEKMFWSGNKDLAGKIAAEKGKIILEQTPGGKVIDGWEDLNNTFSWKKEDMPPHGWDLWGEVSARYSRGASGEIDVIQDFEKFPGGGPTWRGREWPTIVEEGKVTSINIFSMDKAGNVLETMTVKPYGAEAEALFGGK